MLITYEMALEYVNTYLDDIDRLIRLNYIEGKDKEDELVNRIRGFIISGFEDSEKKLRQISNPYSHTLKTETERQEKYIKDLKFIKNNLIGIKEEIILKKSIPQIPKSEFYEKLEKSEPLIHQEFHGEVGNVSGRDITINNVTTTIYLNALEDAIAKSDDIPDNKKTNLIQKIRQLKNDPMVKNLSTVFITEAIKHLLH